MFAMARDRRLPKSLALVSKRNGAPLGAAAVVVGVAVVNVLVNQHLTGLFALPKTPHYFAMFAWESTFGGFALVCVYLLMSIGALRESVGSPEAGRLRAAAVIGIVITAGVVFASFYKVSSPTILAPGIAVVLFLVGLASTEFFPGREPASVRLAALTSAGGAVPAAAHGPGGQTPAGPGSAPAPAAGTADGRVAGAAGRATTALVSRFVTSQTREHLARVDAEGRILDVTLFLMRIVLGWVFIYHGAGKLFGVLGGYGFAGTSHYFSSLGLNPGPVWALTGGCIEFFGGIGMLLGLGSRLWGLALCGDMVMAILSTNWANGLIAEKAAGGYEINLALGALALAIALLGPGRFSLDRYLGLERALGLDRWARRPRLAHADAGAPAMAPRVSAVRAEQEIAGPGPSALSPGSQEQLAGTGRHGNP
jgi:putative oxidoreductase